MITRLKIPLAVAAVIAFTPAAQAAPLYGGQGLSANAAALADYVRNAYPGMLSIGGWRPCDWVGEHCSGRAIDVMVGGNTALGNAIYADIMGNPGRFGITYALWQTTAHWDHIHFSVRG